MIRKVYIKKGRLGLKRYNLRCPHCRTDHYVSYWWIRLKFLLYGEHSWHHHCPVCHKTTTKRIMFNIVNDHTDKDERIMNGRKNWDERMNRL